MNTSFVLSGEFDHKIAKKIQMLPLCPHPSNLSTCIRNQIGATGERIKEGGCLIQFYRPYGERRERGGGRRRGGRGEGREGIGVLNS